MSGLLKKLAGCVYPIGHTYTGRIFFMEFYSFGYGLGHVFGIDPGCGFTPGKTRGICVTNTVTERVKQRELTLIRALMRLTNSYLIVNLFIVKSEWGGDIIFNLAVIS